VDVRDNQLTRRNLLAVYETHGSSALCVADNFLNKRVGADLAPCVRRSSARASVTRCIPPLTRLLPAFCRTEAKSQPSSAPPASSGEAPKNVAKEPNTVFVASDSSVWFAHDLTLCRLKR